MPIGVTLATVAGVLLDVTLAGTAFVQAFQTFRQARPADETPAQAAAEFVREMLAQVQKEAEADAAIDAWLGKHGRADDGNPTA